MSLLNRLRAWRKGPAAEATARWVVLDVESSGLNPRQDRLLAIAAIALRVNGPRAVIELGDSFEVVLQQAPRSGQTDRANILLHGIGVGAQSAGMARPQALQTFQAYVADAPLIAFHAAFDRAMIDRAFQAEALPPPPNPWLDLEPLAAVLQPQVKARSLDEWMRAMNIRCAVRHQAAADTLATAELLLKLWPRLLTELPRPEFPAVQALAAHRRWMPS
jgi:DNA polymerase-3 subunit epsilon